LPQILTGKKLLAHELTHVQQNVLNGKSINLNRYEAPEHQDIGDKALTDLAEFLKTPAGKEWAKKYQLDPNAIASLPEDPILQGGKIKVNTLELTPGDLIALMGDFYRTPEALAKAPPAEIKEILAAIKRERAGELGGGKANAVYQAITLKYRQKSETFLELAKVNAPHFTPTNRAAWKTLHLEAIKKAKQVALGQGDFQEALMIDAAGGHFLTDAFASGHLFNKKNLEDAIIIHLRQNPPRSANPELQAYYGLVESQGVTHQLVLKNIHDRLNTEGVQVTNKKGMKWRTYGDDHLKNAPETSRIAALAVYLSRQQVMQVQNKNAPAPNPDEVLDLLPDEQSIEKVTAQAISYIPAAVQSLPDLLYRQRMAAKEGLKAELPLIGQWIPAIVESNLETTASSARRKQILELEEKSRSRGMPLIAPSFTIKSW
jgi:hypothetical protein